MAKNWPRRINLNLTEEQERERQKAYDRRRWAARRIYGHYRFMCLVDGRSIVSNSFKAVLHGAAYYLDRGCKHYLIRRKASPIKAWGITLGYLIGDDRKTLHNTPGPYNSVMGQEQIENAIRQAAGNHDDIH